MQNWKSRLVYLILTIVITVLVYGTFGLVKNRLANR